MPRIRVEEFEDRYGSSEERHDARRAAEAAPAWAKFVCDCCSLEIGPADVERGECPFCGYALQEEGR